MKLQVIKTDKGYVAVSDEKLKRDDWGIDLTESLLTKCLRTEENSYWNKNCKKIIATDTSFKLQGVPQFKLPAVLDGAESVDKAAQEKGCYTEDDMRNAYMTGSISSLNWNKAKIEENFNHLKRAEEYINSLKQPKQLVGIEVDHEMIGHPHEWVDTPILIKSEEYPNGLLTVKQYYYE